MALKKLRTGKDISTIVMRRMIDATADQMMSETRCIIGGAAWGLALVNVCDKIRVTVQKGRL